MKFFYWTIAILTIVSFSVRAGQSENEKGIIKGKVIDAKTGETVPGASVIIDGTTIGSNTDLDGNYTIGNLEPGTYTVLCKFMAYDTKKITGVIVKAKDVAIVSISIKESTSIELGGVVVEATMNKENNSSLMVLQKNNASVSDGISSESIKTTPDKSSSDVIKRISGASIQDNKFAIIRGMNDRYVSAYINGAPLPSTEPDRKAFAFDMFPSSLLDNLIILKTATPDMPGDFAGGVIMINTKSIPKKNQYNISVSNSINSLTTFNNFTFYNGGKLDWLGIDDGGRQLPSDLPSTEDYAKLTNDERANYAKSMVYDWGLKNKMAMPNTSVQYSMAHVGKIFKKESGSIFALTYANNNATTVTNRREFEESSDEITKSRDFMDTSYNNSVQTSALWNISYKLNENNMISLKNLYSINTDDKVTCRSGLFDVAGPTWEKSNVRWFTQNNIYSGQLSGDHLLPKSKIKFKWISSLSSIDRSIPNLRKVVYQKTSGTKEDSIPFIAVVQANGVYPNSSGSMFFSSTHENIYSGRYDVSIPYEVKKSKHELKVGGFHQLRSREFNARLLGFTKYQKGSSIKFDNNLLLLSENEIYAAENLGLTDNTAPYNGGYKLTEATSTLDNYKASSMLNAAFLMVDSKMKEKFRFIYGARVESYNQKLKTNDALNKEITSDTTVIDLLPSINLVWSVTEFANIRMAYYRTVCRPEFRELAPFNFYDFISDFQISGTPTLKRASINNFDIRYEYFPGAGQILSGSVFYKDIHNAIEQIGSTASQIRSIFFANVDRATNLGMELEYRFKLSVLFKKDSSLFLNHSTIFTNLSLVTSKVDVSDVIGSEFTKTRPLQGQSPVIINAGYLYNNRDKGWSAAASYNFVGKRIFIVGSSDEPTYWEKPRNVIDLQVAKKFKDKFEIKFNAKDILAQRVILYQDINKNGKLDNTSLKTNENISRYRTDDNIMVNTFMGRTFSLSASLKF